GGAPPPTPIAGTAAGIGPTQGVAFDPAGNVYISAIDLSCVFKLDTSGILTRIAGNCRPGYSGDGGAAVNAQLSRPTGLAMDSAGNLFIADSGNHVIRKVSSTGGI